MAAEAEYKRFLHAYGYIIGERIGKGSFGTVYRCTKFGSQGQLETFAVKIVDIRLLKLESKTSMETKLRRLEREISIMQRLDHPHIVKLHEVYRTKEAFFMVMDLVLGIDLFEMIVAENGLKRVVTDEFGFTKVDETLCAQIFLQVANAIAYMHSIHILHRDIKPENIILQAGDMKNNQLNVKLIDFGLSKVISDDDITTALMDPAFPLSLQPSKAKSLVGTPKYIAPEIVKNIHGKHHHKRNAYDEKVDCYSMGVLLHVMLGACFPQFVDLEDGDEAESTNESSHDERRAMNLLGRSNKTNIRSRLVFHDDRINNISEEAKNLIVGLLESDPEKRMSMKLVLNHEWLVKNIKPRENEKRKEAPDGIFGEALDATGPFALLGLKRHVSISKQVSEESPSFDSKVRKMNTQDTSPSAHPYTTSRPPLMDFNQQKMDTGDSVESVKFLNDERSGYLDAENMDLMLNKGGVAGPKALEDPQRILMLQANIATCLKVAYNQFLSDESIAPHIVGSAVGSRDLLRVTSTLLSKLEQTAASVLSLLPDLQLAVEEGEFELANTLFGTIKEWIDELKNGATALLDKNAQVIARVDCAIAAIRAKHRTEAKTMVRDALGNISTAKVGMEQILLNKVNEAVRRGSEVTVEQVASMLEQAKVSENVNGVKKENSSDDPNSPNFHALQVMQVESSGNTESATLSEAQELVDALDALRQVDRLLQRHASFWCQMEVLIQILQQRANHVKGMTHFTRNPKLRGRYMQRIEEYAHTWDNVRLMCQRFNVKAGAITTALYAFLTD